MRVGGWIFIRHSWSEGRHSFLKQGLSFMKLLAIGADGGQGESLEVVSTAGGQIREKSGEK